MESPPAWFSPRKYTIDLSLPPEQRYQHVVADFKEEIKALPVLFDEVLEQVCPGRSPEVVKRIAPLLLRRLRSREETRELVGIHQTTGIDMYLLIAFNVLLDLFMGCTSGGVRVGGNSESSRMLHFRTLDWGMDPLRKVVVHLEFVESTDRPVLASCISYAGYVGILTGIKQGLSMSLNFRPSHDASTRLKNFRFYFHHLLVLFGIKPSISSLLRGCLLSSSTNSDAGHDLNTIEQQFPTISTTAAYLIFSDGKRTVTMEKDYTTASVRSATDFIVTTNHDREDEIKPSSTTDHIQDDTAQTLQATGMMTLVEESTDRKNCIVKLYNHATRKGSTRGSQRRHGFKSSIQQSTVAGWVDTYPITNEETHFSCLMDPKAGKFLCIKCYPEVQTEK